MEGGSRTSRIRSLCRGDAAAVSRLAPERGTEVKGRSEVQINKTQFESPGRLRQANTKVA